MDNIIYIYDENENTVPYEIIDRLNIDSNEYVAILRYYEDDEESSDDEILIFETKHDGDDIYFEPIENDSTFDLVARSFRERLSYLYNIED